MTALTEPKKPHFISLRWKSSILATVLFVALINIIGWQVLNTSQQQLLADLKQDRQQYQVMLQHLFASSATELANLGHLLLDDSIKLASITRDTTHNIEQHWQRLQQDWQLASLRLDDGQGYPLLHIGQPLRIEIINWIHDLPKNIQAPANRLHCRQVCIQYTVIPVFTESSSAPHRLILAKHLNTNLKAFEFDHKLEIASVFTGQTENQDLPWWNANVVNLSERGTLLPVVSKLSQTVPIGTLLDTPQIITLNDNFYAAWLNKIPFHADKDTHLLLLNNINDRQHKLDQDIKRTLVYSTVGLAVTCLILLLLSQAYISRIKHHLKLIPKLESKQFNEVRSELPHNEQITRWFVDEFDQLNQATNDLTNQYESLEHTVTSRTEEMQRLSLFDPLTGLANRNLLQYELQSDVDNIDQSGNKLLALILIDLDKFKRINDALSHQEGDNLLAKIAQRLKGATQHLGIIARMGGDEFALLLHGFQRASQAESLSQKILALVAKPISLDNHPNIEINASIGVAIYTEDCSPHDLIKQAEIALYKAKAAGGGHVQVYSPDMADAFSDTLSLEGEIKRAFKEKEYTLYLQPKVNMDAKIEGFEALARWDHPDRGILSPAEFIPVIEKIGLIHMLDNWVLEASCRQLNVWKEHFPQISLAVNISSTHFTDQRFLETLKQCLKKYPIDPNTLELEITETLLMENLGAGLDVINQIKELGVSIAIDDFGTGYSSLSYLKTLPIDTLKIDREFIKDIPESEADMQISSIIIYLAKQLGYKVVAEGVETSEQMVFLKANRCDLAQGFYFSKPVPAHKTMVMLEYQQSGHTAL